jgi:hypothetical protein
METWKQGSKRPTELEIEVRPESGVPVKQAEEDYVDDTGEAGEGGEYGHEGEDGQYYGDEYDEEDDEDAAAYRPPARGAVSLLDVAASKKPAVSSPAVTKVWDCVRCR